MKRFAAALLLTVATAGCAQPQQNAAADVARRLTAAVQAGDGAAVCGLLAPETLAKVDEPCAATIRLPVPGPIQTVDVYGQWARVVTSGDTLFLGAFGDGWRVVAAGCRPRGERPYDCSVQGD